MDLRSAIVDRDATALQCIAKENMELLVCNISLIPCECWPDLYNCGVPTVQYALLTHCAETLLKDWHDMQSGLIVSYAAQYIPNDDQAVAVIVSHMGY